MQRGEQPHRLRTLVAETRARGDRVVFLAGQGLVPGGPGGWLVERPRGGPVEEWRAVLPLVERALTALREPPLLARLLAEALERGLVDRVIYFGVDGVLARLAPGDAVLELYGSVIRGKCTRCGRRHPVAEPPRGGAPRCRECGAPLAPDIVWRGELPRQRVVSEAVYEATTAGLLLACCLEGDMLASTLAASATRFTRLILLGEDPVLGSIAHARLRDPLEELRLLLGQERQ